MRYLERANKPLVEQLMTGKVRNVLAQKPNRTARWLKSPRYQVEKCCFSGPVRPNQSGDTVFFDAKRAAIDGPEPAKIHNELIKLQHSSSSPPPARSFLFRFGHASPC